MRASKKRRNQPPKQDVTASPQKGGHSLVEIQAQWEGPLPPPESLARFNDIVPDGAERIVSQWEHEAAHRRKYEQRALTASIVEQLGSRVLSFLFAVSALGVAAYCVHIGAYWPAAVIGGTTIAAVVTAMMALRPK